MVVHPQHVAAAVDFFNTRWDRGFEICTGSRYLGGYVGTDLGYNKFVTKKVMDFTGTVKELAMVASKKYHHTVYTGHTGHTKSLQHQWTHPQRVVPDIAPLFVLVEAAIADLFLPAIYGEQVNETVQSLAALPVKCAGLAITNQVQASLANYMASTHVCLHLLQAIQGKAKYCEYTHKSTTQGSSLESSARRQDAARTALVVILVSLPLTDGKPRVKRIIARGCETGSYLLTIPSTINGSTL